MERYEALFESGSADRLPFWTVVEWTHVNANGRLTGRTLERYSGNVEGEKQALHVASILNRADTLGARH